MNTEHGIRVLVIDDHKLIVIGIKTILENSDINFTHIDCVTSSTEALDLMKRQTYDLYIIDIEMPDINGFELISSLRKLNSQARIIVNTIHEEIWFFRQIEKYEVNAIVCKSFNTDVMMQAVKAVMAGQKFYPQQIMPQHGRKMTQSPLYGNELSKSELKVLQLIAEGLKTIEIADRMFISKNTVQTHRQHINEKLGTNNSAGMIIQGIKLGLIDVE